MDNYILCQDGVANPADRFIDVRQGDGSVIRRGYYEGTTGNVYDCSSGQAPDCANADPVVRILGDLAGETGQVKLRQSDGNYRRLARWDRIGATPLQPNATLRTLPQCGCGGSLGMPKLFDSFPQMSAYFYHTFHAAEQGCPVL